MKAFFFEVLDLSASGIIIVGTVIVLRFILRKKPRRMFCFLWSIAFLKLIFPFSIPFRFAVLPHFHLAESNQTLFVDYENHKLTNSSMIFDSSVVFFPIIVWMFGIFILIAYQIICALKVRRIIKCSRLLRDNIFMCEKINSPFVIGFLNPKIFIPIDLNKASIEMVLAHEQVHILHHDNFRKMIAWIVLSVHWFNPFIWIAYTMFCSDMEISCDETVIAALNKKERKKYAYIVLMQSQGKNKNVCASFFGGIKAKERVEKILNYKKLTRKEETLCCILLLTFMLIAVTKNVDVEAQVTSEAKEWAALYFGQNYELRSLEGTVIREFETQEQKRYVVRLSCEITPKFNHVDDGMLEKDANFGNWEETMLDVVVEGKSNKMLKRKIYPEQVY